MQIPALQTHPRPAALPDLPLDRVAASTQLSEPQKLAAASRAFEAVLLRQILSETQQPAFPSKLIGNSSISGIYRDMIVDQMAENISRSGSFGLAKSLTQELQRQSGTVGAAPRAAARNPVAPSSAPQP